tara:strand:- start:2553 stop:4628 length:2076 start_codon:yes stop_codon:yes gene_type:complete
MSKLFIELLSEEIPYWLQKNIVEQFANRLTDVIINNNLSLIKKVNVNYNFTSQRLIFSCENLIEKQSSLIKEIKGPSISSPESAIIGFSKKIKIKKENLKKKEIKGKEYYFAEQKITGKKTENIIKENLENIITTLNWNKSMRWIHNSMKWGRPIKNIFFYFDNKFIALDFLDLYSINNNFFTLAHKKIDKKIKFKNFDEYKKKLISSKVIIEQNKREERIEKKIKAFCKEKKIFLKNEHIPLISLNAGLNEYPDILFGKIEKGYMSLPQEILEVVMINDQDFIPLFDNNNLSQYFVIIVDYVEKKFQKTIIEDNEKVLQARFEDAAFYWKNDLKIKLEKRKQLLSDIQFHQKLGSFEDKTKRLEYFATNLASQLNFKINSNDLIQAVKLSKLDLTTGLVREFPELQGIIGGYIAEVEKKNQNICLSIKEQYLPKGPSDKCPKNNLSILLSFSDKLDTLLGFFLIDEAPTSSKDPYALRRSALGILRIIIENNLKIEFKEFFNNTLLDKYNLENINNDKIKNLMNFLIERFKFFLRSITKKQDVVNAFFIEKSTSYNFLNLYRKFLALNEFVNKNEGKRIIELNKRVSNIVTIERKKIDINNFINKDLLKEGPEKDLVHELDKLKNKIANEEEDFKSVLNSISNLYNPLNNFFDNVMVNVDDIKIKNNRLSILKKVLDTLKIYADFSKIQK